MGKVVIETKTEDAVDVGREVPMIEPKDQGINRTRFPFCKLPGGDMRQYLQSAGLAWKEVLIVAPAGMLPSDLHEHPRAWAKLQGQPMLALSFLDRVTVVSADQTWMVEGRVMSADSESVTFKPTASVKLPQQPTVAAKPTHSESRVEQTMVRA